MHEVNIEMTQTAGRGSDTVIVHREANVAYGIPTDAGHSAPIPLPRPVRTRAPPPVKPSGHRALPPRPVRTPGCRAPLDSSPGHKAPLVLTPDPDYETMR